MRKMKDSGIEWIGEIPEEWKTRPLKSLFGFGKGLPITKENLTESGVSVISYGQIHSKTNDGVHITSDLIRFVDENYLKSNPSSLANKNDFIFADTSEDLEGCGNCVFNNLDTTLFAGYHTIILQSNTGYNNQYFAYLFKSDIWRKQIREQVTGVKLFSISQKILKSVSVIVPPLSEQQKIAAHLDRICSEIDSVIEKTKATIEEYKKLKQAIITQAVTKGIRKGRKMKDSGSVWFDTIPFDWNFIKLKYHFKIKKEIAGQEGYTVLSITQKGIIPKNISSNEGQLAADYSNYQLVNSGDFAMNHMDLLTGWVDISRFDGVTSPDYRVFVIKNPDLNDSRYFLFLMQVCYMNKIFYGLGQGVSGLGRWRLQADKFLNFYIPIPPKDEQHEIVTFLDEKCSEIDKLIAKKEQLLTQLESYKKSVIYEYVTGKKEVI